MVQIMEIKAIKEKDRQTLMYRNVSNQKQPLLSYNEDTRSCSEKKVVNEILSGERCPHSRIKHTLPLNRV